MRVTKSWENMWSHGLSRLHTSPYRTHCKNLDRINSYSRGFGASAMSRTSANYVSKTYHTALKPNSCWNLRRHLALRHLSSCQWKICKNTDPTLQSRLLWNLPTCASTPARPCKSLTWTSGTVGASATSGTVGASATSVSNISDWLTASKGGQDSSESPRFSWQNRLRRIDYSHGMPWWRYRL